MSGIPTIFFKLGAKLLLIIDLTYCYWKIYFLGINIILKRHFVDLHLALI